MLAFKCLAGRPGRQEILEEEYRQAERFQEIRLGQEHLFHRAFIRVKYLSYDPIRRAFIRMESGESGDLPISAIYLVLVDESGKEIRLHMERQDTAKKMLARMEQICPDVLYGFTK